MSSLFDNISLNTLIIGSVIGISIVFIVRKLFSKPAHSHSNNNNRNIILEEKKEEIPPFLNRQRQSIVLSRIEVLSHDTRLFRFALDHKKQVLGLPIGKHIKVFCPNPKGVVEGKWNGQDDAEANQAEIQRSYTPVTSDDDLGHVDFVIKIYKGGVIDRFPDGGKMSQYFGNLQVGDAITVSGPFGLVEYKGRGVFNWKGKTINAKHVGMLAGGTGITPMLQVIHAIFKDPTDTTEVWLLFANQTEDDILVRNELETVAQRHPDRFHLWYTLDRPTDSWRYSSGFINEEMIANHLPPASSDAVVLMCGPPPMIKFACVPNLTKVGFAPETHIVF